MASGDEIAHFGRWIPLEQADDTPSQWIETEELSVPNGPRPAYLLKLGSGVDAGFDMFGRIKNYSGGGMKVEGKVFFDTETGIATSQNLNFSLHDMNASEDVTAAFTYFTSIVLIHPASTVNTLVPFSVNLSSASQDGVGNDDRIVLRCWTGVGSGGTGIDGNMLIIPFTIALREQ